MTGATNAGTVVTRLLELFAATLPGVKVIDGPQVSDVPKRALHVAAALDVDAIVGADIVNVTDWGPMGDYAQDEVFQIPCLLFHWDGHTKVARIRAAAFADFQSCQAAVRADPTLGLAQGTVRALISSWSLSADQGDAGAYSYINFVVTVESRISS